MQYLVASCPLTALCEAAKDPYVLGTLVGAVAVSVLIGFIIGRLTKRGGESYYSSSSGGEDDGSCVEIYVGNLSYDMTETQMRKEFERYGAVKSARIISNRFNNKSKGYGFIEMLNRPEAEAAIKALHDKDIFGRKLRVNEAKNKSHE